MIAAGGSHSLVISRVGSLFAFGKGGRGQLGLGVERRDGACPPNARVPTRVEGCGHSRALLVLKRSSFFSLS